jgi:hypothetical protein
MRRVAVFFETHGVLLARAAQALQDEVVPALDGDPEARSKAKAVAQFIGETGCLWSEAFAALAKENQILGGAMQDAAKALGTTPPAADAGAADPLAHNACLLRDLDDAIDRLHDTDDAARELTDVRTALNAVAALEASVARAARARWRELADAHDIPVPLREGR